MKGFFTNPKRFAKGWGALVTLGVSTALLLGVEDATVQKASVVAVNLGTFISVVLFPNTNV